MMLDTPAAICFDFDGTILRADELILSATRKGFLRSGLSVPTDEQVFKTVGLSLKEVVLHVHPQLENSRVEAAVNHLLQAFTDERERTGGEQNLSPISGFDKFSALAKERGIPTGVVSSKPKHSLEFAVKGLGLAKSFTHVISTTDFKAKPDPSSLVDFFDRLSLPPNQCVYVGDTVADGLMAINAGAMFWGAGWGYSGRKELEKNGFNSVFDSYDAMTAHLAALG